jgi:ABC-type sugar transport system permease subunit
VSTSSAAAQPQAIWRRLARASFGYILLSPALLVILGLNLYPTVSGVLTSFTNQSLIDPGHSAFVGLENYFKLLQDPIFQISLLHSLELTFLAVLLQVVLGLVMAHLLIQKVPGIHLFRSVAMITWVLPIIASVVMFRFMTLPNYGLVNCTCGETYRSTQSRSWPPCRRYPPISMKPPGLTERVIGGSSGSSLSLT